MHPWNMHGDRASSVQDSSGLDIYNPEVISSGMKIKENGQGQGAEGKRA